MRISIRYQLLLPLLALMLGLVGVSTWSAWASGQRARRQIEAQIDAIAQTINSASYPINTRTLQLMRGLSGAEFLLCDQTRQPIVDTDGQPIATLTQLPDSLPAPSKQTAQPFDRTVRIGSTSYLCGGVPLTHGTRPGTILYILYPESLMNEAVREALSPALTLGIVGSVISIILSVILTQQFTARIQQLERRTRLIAEGDFSPLPLPNLDDELRDLGKSVNEMAQRLTQFQETIRQTERLRLLGQVSGGLAHQLRNGVAGARLAVQLHAQDCPGTEDHEALAVALRQLSLVEMHLKRFLDLGKAVMLNRQPCQLDAIVRETAELLGPHCRHAHIDLRLKPDGATPIDANVDAEQLGQLLLNIITNAIEAAGPHGWVEVRWGVVTSDCAYIEVRDSGLGPAADVAPRLFEPFATGKREGVGLGLAVAQQIAHTHGGTLTWSREPDCTCFRLELPV
jgi:signal transduction histidine kinase